MKAARFVVALLVVASLPLQAQEEAINKHARKGFWISFGFGAGSLGASCDGCGDLDRETGVSGYLRLGGTISQNILIGGGTNGFYKDSDGIKQQFGAVSALILWYPSARGGLYLQGGLGYSLYSATDGIDDIDAGGASALLGIGYDIRLGTNFSLTPFFNVAANGGAEAKFNDVGLGANLNTNLAQLGLGVSWH
jgi:hypothetical protein